MSVMSAAGSKGEVRLCDLAGGVRDILTYRALLGQRLAEDGARR